MSQIRRVKGLPVRETRESQHRPHLLLQIGVGELNGYRFWVRFPFYHNGYRARVRFRFYGLADEVVRAQPLQVSQAR